MAARVWPADAVTGAPSYTGRALRQTQAPMLASATAGRPLGAYSGVRPGTPAATVTATSTTWTVTPFAGVIDLEAAAISGPYTFAFDANVTGAVTAANATNPRVDILSVRINDGAEGDGTVVAPFVDIVYTAGTAAAVPVAPATPARSFVIANINVPTSGGGSPTVTFNAPIAVAAGAPLIVATSALLSAVVGHPGEIAWVTADRCFYSWNVAGSVWYPDINGAPFQPSGAAVTKPFRMEFGILKIATAVVSSISGTVSFSRAFASAPHVTTNIIGYRATGAYNPIGLTTTTIELWSSKAYANTTALANLLVAQTGTFSAGFDVYVSWSAIGEAV